MLTIRWDRQLETTLGQTLAQSIEPFGFECERIFMFLSPTMYHYELSHH